MNKLLSIAVSGIFFFLSPIAVQADDNGRVFLIHPGYNITITNITSNQVFSPPVIALHRRGAALFEAGAAASEGLALMAEDGDASLLADELDALPEVAEIFLADAPIPPGESRTYELSAPFRANRLSVAGMLVNTNDTFFALNSVSLPAAVRGPRSSTFNAIGYDAGSEENNEDCGFIPGPACEGAGAGVRAPDGAEGFVHVSDGIHGIADIAPERYDWRNPVARIIVEQR